VEVDGELHPAFERTVHFTSEPARNGTTVATMRRRWKEFFCEGWDRVALS
jgi:hypothetical protein